MLLKKKNRLYLLLMLFIVLITSQMFGQNELKGVWKGYLTKTVSYVNWRYEQPRVFVEMDFDSLKAKYFVREYGEKIFPIKTIENKFSHGNQIIIYLPEYELFETTLNVERNENNYIIANGANGTIPPFSNVYLSIKKFD